MKSNSIRFHRLASLRVLSSLLNPAARAQAAVPDGARPETSDRARMLARLNLPAPPTPGKNRNHDEAKANIFPNLPDALVLKNGQPVRDADTWWKQRRPEIFDDLMGEIYGEVPQARPRSPGRSPLKTTTVK